MRYFHCPEVFRNKPYGCGAGPFNGTQMFLDFAGRCPKCGLVLKPHKDKPVQRRTEIKNLNDTINFVDKTFGKAAAERYAKEKGSRKR